MLFNSIDFIIFFPIVVALYFASPERYRWLLLLSASYFFYAYWKLSYVVLIFITTAVSFVLAKQIYLIQQQNYRKLLLVACLVVDLGILFIFKYFNFFSYSIREFMGGIGINIDTPLLDVLLPVGISFYTFQSLSYVIDVYRGQLKPERHFGIFALYVSFFPQLVAGPIERPAHLLPQFHSHQPFSVRNIKEGGIYILWGFFLKLVISDRVGPYVDSIFGDIHEFTGGHFVLATYLFAYQIFCDFAGYSLIALGTAKVMGYELMHNFRRPYLSQSINEFWTRWHISLSTWFRDYLYIPLGGNRVSKGRVYFNLMIVFLVSGWWHGANWTFMVWGGLHGFYLVFSRVIENIIASVFGREKQRITVPESKLKVIFNRFVTFQLVCLAWVFFRADSVGNAFYILSNLFTGWRFELGYLAEVILPFTYNNSAIEVFLCAIAFIVFLEIVNHVQEKGGGVIYNAWFDNERFRAICIVLLCVCILLFGKFFSNASFIYFQF